MIDGNRAVLSGVKVMLGPLITEPGSTILNLDDAKSQHILMVASLTERTMLLRALWYQLVRQNRPNALRFMVIDPESVLPISVQNSAHLLCRPVQRCEDQTDDLLQLEIRHALQTVAREIQQRRLRSSNYPHLVVVITNITPLLKRPGLLSLLNHIIEQGREVSVHVVGGTSDITHFTLKHPLIQNNFKARLVGQMPDSATSDLACGAPDFFCEWGMGDGDITYTLTHQRFQCGIVSDGELKFLPRAIGLPSIWNMGAS
ncbi:MAG: hypothetical protein HC853_01085 [Anaerolineae bacterium]|nr:hypothetical protein [Anaerolineae bacterium]